MERQRRFEADVVPPEARYRDCRVSFVDRAGIQHSVVVSAINRYHAFGLALNKMRDCSWSDPESRGVEKMTIELMDSRWGKIIVTKRGFESWLGTPESATAKDDKLKIHLLMLLKRMPPDRAFQEWLQSRR